MAIHHPLALLAAAISCSSAIAQTVDADAAQALARQFFTTHNTVGGPNRAPAKIEPVLAYTAQTDGTPDLYIFNRAEDQNGFVIISADATDTPILGYSDTSTFDPVTAPPALQWWLQQYQLFGAAKAPARASEPIPPGTIGPLITTTWNQFEPYYNAIPHSTFVPFVTGCTATAMAQLMKFHTHPTTGQGSNSYTITYNKTTPITFEANFGATTYDWANMIDNYTIDNGVPNYTTTQANAVATLMYHAGVAEHTIFNGDQSSADDRHAAQALIRNFRYDPSMLRAEHQFVNDADWFNILYAEIRAGYPVLYSGTTPADEGHSFICDGYKDGLFHINWGWGGLSDGYFALTGSNALRPGQQGVGGAPSGQGFTQTQTITYNIRPDHSGTPACQYAIFQGGHMTLNAESDPLTTYTLDRTTTDDHFLHYHYTPYNYGINPIAFEYGVMFRNVDDATTYVYKHDDTNNLKSGTMGAGSYYVDSDNNPKLLDYTFPTSVIQRAGTYDVLPAYRPMGESQWLVAEHDVDLTIPRITVIGDYVAPAEPLVPDLIDGICFYDYPYIGRNNLTNSENLALIIPLVNNTDETAIMQMYGVVELDKLTLTLPINDVANPRAAGTRIAYTFALGKNMVTVNDVKYPITHFLTPGKTYTIRFYTNTNYNVPMNVPTLTFYYDGDLTTTISDLTTIVQAAIDGKAPKKLIKAAADYILGK